MRTSIKLTLFIGAVCVSGIALTSSNAQRSSVNIISLRRRACFLIATVGV